MSPELTFPKWRVVNGWISILGELSLKAKRCLFVALLKSIGICITRIDVQTRPLICRTEKAQSRVSTCTYGLDVL